MLSFVKATYLWLVSKSILFEQLTYSICSLQILLPSEFTNLISIILYCK